MGKKSINTIWKEIEKKSDSGKLSKALNDWYSTHFVSIEDQREIDKIRKTYQEKIELLEREYQRAYNQISLNFMQFELDFLNANDNAKKENEAATGDRRGITLPNTGGGIRGLLRRAIRKTAAWRLARLNSAEADRNIDALQGEADAGNPQV